MLNAEVETLAASSRRRPPASREAKPETQICSAVSPSAWSVAISSSPEARAQRNAPTRPRVPTPPVPISTLDSLRLYLRPSLPSPVRQATRRPPPPDGLSLLPPTPDSHPAPTDSTTHSSP
ncbi:unnamed protein product [Linum trigynum]|uniref:Uncharacterized protein n=1 Tax=Linum trigynum TaxID=586398 RepID=A0AAV2FQ56_9ROSI